MQNERHLFATARSLDETALLTIFDRYAPKVYLHALRRCHDPALADDIVSRVFAKYLEEVAEGHEPGSGLQTYFYRSTSQYLPEGKTGWKDELLGRIFTFEFKRPEGGWQ